MHTEQMKRRCRQDRKKSTADKTGQKQMQTEQEKGRCRPDRRKACSERRGRKATADRTGSSRLHGQESEHRKGIRVYHNLIILHIDPWLLAAVSVCTVDQ
jgi:hypothetical protein